MCDEALELIRKAIADLDSASLFASAGQLDDTSNGKSNADALSALKAGCKGLSGTCSQLLEAAQSTDVAVGEAAKAVAESVSSAAKEAIVCAGQIRFVFFRFFCCCCTYSAKRQCFTTRATPSWQGSVHFFTSLHSCK